MVNAMNREGCIDTGSNPVLATKNYNMEQKVLDIVELGLKEDGTFYSSKEKTAMILKLIEQAYDDAIKGIYISFDHNDGADYVKSF
jgi:hypothetical protein